MDELETDVHDVFALLYNDDDWLPFDDEEEAAIQLKTPQRTPEPHPDLNEIVPSEDELRASINAVLAGEAEGDARDQGRFSSKRIREAVDSLLGTRNAVAGPSKRRKIDMPLAKPPPPPPVSPYHPQSLLARLQTFKPASYTTKPAALSEMEAARCGWVNDGSEALRCAKGCDAWWKVGRIRENEETLAKKMSKMLIDAHKAGCPWRVRQTPASQLAHLRQQMHPPLSSSLEPLARKIEAACSASNAPLTITSPLNPAQISILLHSLNAHAPDSPPLGEAAAQAALFGWSPSPKDAQILTCHICLRRIGLWTLRKPMDVVQEHLRWCPVGARGAAGGTEWWSSAAVLRSDRAPKGLGSLGVARKRAKRPIAVS